MNSIKYLSFFLSGLLIGFVLFFVTDVERHLQEKEVTEQKKVVDDKKYLMGLVQKSGLLLQKNNENVFLEAQSYYESLIQTTDSIEQIENAIVELIYRTNKSMTDLFKGVENIKLEILESNLQITEEAQETERVSVHHKFAELSSVHKKLIIDYLNHVNDAYYELESMNQLLLEKTNIDKKITDHFLFGEDEQLFFDVANVNIDAYYKTHFQRRTIHSILGNLNTIELEILMTQYEFLQFIEPHLANENAAAPLYPEKEVALNE